MNSGNMNPRNGQRPNGTRQHPQKRPVGQRTAQNGRNVNQNARKRSKKNRRSVLDYYIIFVLSLIAIFSVLLAVQSNKADKKSASDVPVSTESQSETRIETSEKTDETTAVKVEKEDPVPEFKADLSAYEEYMNPKGEKRDAYLLLVSPSNPLSENFVPEELTELVNTRKDGRATQKMSLYAAKALEALYLDADANGMLNKSTGYVLSVTSAYRSYANQKSNFNNYVNQEMKANSSLSKSEAEKIVSAYCNPAGSSEHQTGLCCDMHNQASANSDYPEVFANTPEGKWLTENCWKYGFVLRYPLDKTDVTKITYESWHFRYVGRYHAKRMTDMNMCLEEYVEYLNKQ